MAEVGLSQYAVEHILKRYPAYVNWDVEQKLLPAMHQWQQHLGKSFQAEFARLPRLLLGTPGQEVAKLQYLASIGVTSAKRNPAGWHHASLKAMQSKVASLQAFGFTQAQISSLVEQHPGSLASKFKNTEDLFVVLDKLFSCANDIQAIADIVLSCGAKGLCKGFHHLCIIHFPTFAHASSWMTRKRKGLGPRAYLLFRLQSWIAGWTLLPCS